MQTDDEKFKRLVLMTADDNITIHANDREAIAWAVEQLLRFRESRRPIHGSLYDHLTDSRGETQ